MLTSDPPSPSPGPSSINEIFDVMSDESRRRVLYYLRQHAETADVDELREHLSKRTTSDSAEISVDLHHKTLPKLDDVDVIDYDQQSEEVEYDGDRLTTELVDWIGDKERTEW